MTAPKTQGVNTLTLRKEDHLSMAHESQTPGHTRDERFYYEPMLNPHPTTPKPIKFLGHTFNFPLWISSMTGGAEHARNLNSVMAKVCGELGLGMGLGSCRPMLESDDALADFNMRELMGDRPLFANFGIAQIERSMSDLTPIHRVVKTLKAQGLIIHVNPMQEWYQPGGDHFKHSPLETITRFLEKADYPVIVKEVGHGMGPASLKALMSLPLAAIEFGAYGGTNFSVLEARRSRDGRSQELTLVGHTAQEMVGFVRAILATDHVKCDQFIISGGITDSLQGYSLVSQLPGRALFGMAHSVLTEAQKGEVALRTYLLEQQNQFAMAQAYLTPRTGAHT